MTIPGSLTVGSINAPNLGLSSYSKYNPFSQIQFGTASINMSLNNLSILPTTVTHTNGGYVSICTQAFVKNPYSCSNARLTMQGHYATNDSNLYTFQMKLVYNTDNVSPVQNWSPFLDENNSIAAITFTNLRGKDYGLSTACSGWFRYPSQYLNSNIPLYFGLVPIFTPGGQFTYTRAHLDVF